MSPDVGFVSSAQLENAGYARFAMTKRADHPRPSLLSSLGELGNPTKPVNNRSASDTMAVSRSEHGEDFEGSNEDAMSILSSRSAPPLELDFIATSMPLARLGQSNALLHDIGTPAWISVDEDWADETMDEIEEARLAILEAEKWNWLTPPGHTPGMAESGSETTIGGPITPSTGHVDLFVEAQTGGVGRVKVQKGLVAWRK